MYLGAQAQRLNLCAKERKGKPTMFAEAFCEALQFVSFICTSVLIAATAIDYAIGRCERKSKRKAVER